MEKPTRNWLIIGLGVLAALLVINAAVAYQKTWQLHDQTAWVGHTHEVHDALEQLISTIKDAETGQRGYVITGRDEYLQPHQEALIRYGEVIERIGTLTADNRQQQADLPRLRKLVSE